MQTETRRKTCPQFFFLIFPLANRESKQFVVPRVMDEARGPGWCATSSEPIQVSYQQTTGSKMWKLFPVLMCLFMMETTPRESKTPNLLRVCSAPRSVVTLHTTWQVR